MKIKLIYILLFLNLFYKIIASNFLTLPNEIKLYILEKNIIDIIEKNQIYDPLRNVKEFIGNIKLINKDFYLIGNNLFNFAKNYMKLHFAKDYINLKQKAKYKRLRKILSNKYLKNFEKEVAQLIISGIDINIEDLDSNTLLITAVNNNCINIVDILTKYKDLDINHKNSFGNNALIIAIEDDNKDIIDLLLKCKNLDINSLIYIRGISPLILDYIYEEKDIINLIKKHNLDKFYKLINYICKIFY